MTVDKDTTKNKFICSFKHHYIHCCDIVTIYHRNQVANITYSRRLHAGVAIWQQKKKEQQKQVH